MPFKSQAQRRKFYAMANRGEISPETVKRWEEHTGDKKLPERVKQAEATKGEMALGAGLGAAAGGAAVLARKPMARRAVGHFLSSLVKGQGPRAAAKAVPIPKSVAREAKVVAKALKRRGVDPKSARIGISGVGGTGKSVFSRALSRELGIPVTSLDVKKVRSMAEAPKGSIFEQTRLIPRTDPDKFDAMIRVSAPPDVVKSQLKQRGRGAWQWELFDYGKQDAVINTAFHQTKGRAIRVGKGIELKVKPRGGFRADEKLDKALKAKGIDPAGLNRHSKVLSLSAGERQKAILPPLPYVRPGAAAEMIGLPLGGAAAGAILPAALRDTKENRSALKDFLAGVDPTGSYTFQYGMSDASKSEAAAKARAAIGVTGGVVGGSVVVPAAITGLIGGATGGATGGPRGALQGLIEGLKATTVNPYRAYQARKVIDKTIGGAKLTPQEARKVVGVLKSTLESFGTLGERAATSALTTDKGARRAATILSRLPEGAKQQLRTVTSRKLTRGLSMLGLGGAISGTSALIQYRKGRRTGQYLSKKELEMLGKE